MTGTITLLISEPSRALFSKISMKQPIQLEGRVCKIDGELELAVLAGAAAEVKEASALVVAVMNAILKDGLEAGDNAGDQSRISHEIEGPWLWLSSWPPYARILVRVGESSAIAIRCVGAGLRHRD
jgi:hypothetical protein